MKETIKADEQRNKIGAMFLNDNTKIEYTLEDEKVSIVARYVSVCPKCIKEDGLLTITKEEYLNSLDEYLKISEDYSAIAIFKPTEAGYQLDKVYDVEEHSLANPEFMDIIYEERFPKEPLNKQLVLVNQS